ncbi:MAG: glycosyltransferase [Pseudomonadota bacterium]
MAEEKDEIAIIIPHLNQPEDLHRCLLAIDRQRRVLGLQVSIYVVDNGSTSLPTEVCGAFSNVTLLEEKEPGPGPARSRGARSANARLFAFIDADCVPEEHWLAAVLQRFKSRSERTSADFYGGQVRILAGGARLSQIEAYESIYGYRQEMYVNRDRYAATCNLITRSDVFDSVGDFLGLGVAEDREWGQRATKMGYTVGYAEEIIVYTPARRCFNELARKWDRHIAHDWNDLGSDFGATTRWIVRAFALSISPVIEVPTVIVTDRVSGVQNRLRAMICLTRIRFYRAWRMLSIIPKSKALGLENRWRDG